MLSSLQQSKVGARLAIPSSGICTVALLLLNLQRMHFLFTLLQLSFPI